MARLDGFHKETHNLKRCLYGRRDCAACRAWLDGGMLCQEALRDVGDFLAVCRARDHGDDGSAGNSGDLVSDEELEATKVKLSTVLATRIGGREKGVERSTAEGRQPGATHRNNFEGSADLAAGIW